MCFIIPQSPTLYKYSHIIRCDLSKSMSPTCNAFRTNVELEIIFIYIFLPNTDKKKKKKNPFTLVKNPPEGSNLPASLRTIGFLTLLSNDHRWRCSLFFQILSSVLLVRLVMSRFAPGMLLSCSEMNKGSYSCDFCLSHIIHQNLLKFQKTKKNQAEFESRKQHRCPISPASRVNFECP